MVKFVIGEMQKSAFGGGFSGATDEEPSGGYLARLQGANLANRKQDFQNSEQVFSMQIFGADKKSFFILDFKRFWLLIFRNMLRGGTSSTSFKIYELAQIKRCRKVLGQNNLCSSSIKDWAQTHFQKYPHQPWN